MTLEYAAALEAHALPLLVNTLPLVDGATKVTVLVPAPTSTEALVNVVSPVPPCDTTTGMVSVFALRISVLVVGAIPTNRDNVGAELVIAPGVADT